ncbi:MAG: glycosyltransferase family 9 protein [Planctomycetota bacterium]|nr:glycosyltransferase family 9 protein [Planctomycetota bacterium]
MHTAHERILIVRLSHLGDVVHGMPVARAVRLAHPRARVAWIVQPEFAGIVEACGFVDEIIHFERRGGLSGWARVERDLSRFSADWTIDAQGNTKSALVALAARAPRRSGLAREDWAEGYGSLSLNDPAPRTPPRTDGTVHALDKMFTLARHVAPGIEPDDRAIAFQSTQDSERAFADRFGVASGPFAILHLASANDVRSWPVERFEALARELARDHDVLVVSGPSESDLGSRVSRATNGFPRVRHWIGQRDLVELTRVCTGAAEKDAVFVGCDSGPMHIAWASGLRVVVLAGPQDARYTGPWPPIDRVQPEHHRVIRAAPAPHCAPCFSRTCAHPGGNVCMQRIEDVEVAALVRAASNAPRVASGAHALRHAARHDVPIAVGSQR